MPTICSYLNPFSNQFHLLYDFKSLPCHKKIGIVLVTAFVACSIIFTIFTVAVFRSLVGRCIQQRLGQRLDNLTNNTEFADRFISLAKQESNTGMVLMDRRLARVKCFVTCEIAGNRIIAEMNDLASEKGAVTSDAFTKAMAEPLQRVHNWLLQQFKEHGLKEGLRIEGMIFGLMQETIYGSQWSIHRSSREYGTCYFSFDSKGQNLKSLYETYSQKLGLPQNKQVETAEDFFNHLLEPQRKKIETEIDSTAIFPNVLANLIAKYV